METYTKEEWIAEGKRLFGPDFENWKFVCPNCGHVQKVGDFRPFKDQGAIPDSALCECIGRYNGHMDKPLGTKPGPCNYTSEGLYDLNPVTVIDGGKKCTCFPFAGAEEGIATEQEMIDSCKKHACKDCQIAHKCRMFEKIFGYLPEAPDQQDSEVGQYQSPSVSAHCGC